MALTGQAKRDYQREYMRDWQRRRRGSKQPGSKQPDRGKIRASDGYPVQRTNPMMVGYVPPTSKGGDA